MPDTDFIQFAVYILFFPTFIAGPVERFQRFQPQTTDRVRLCLEDINAGLLRIGFGLTKKFVVANSLARYALPVLHAPGEYHPALVLLSTYSMITRIYMDFAGYTDIAIGVARLLGYRITENFNRPLLQPNVALFWRNWHITVYTWIRDYIFFPFFCFRASAAKMYAGIFACIILFMLWHEASWGYLVAGVYHGIGLAAWALFQAAKRQHPGLRRFMATRFATAVSVFVTFTFVSWGALIYTLGFNGIAGVAARILGTNGA